MKIVRRNALVIADVVDGATMLCETNTIAFYRLNKTAGEIWDVCEGRSVEEIAALLARTCEQPDVKTIEAEVEKFINVMVDEALVSFEESTDAG